MKQALKDDIKNFIVDEYFNNNYIPVKQQETIEELSEELSDNLINDDRFWHALEQFYKEFLDNNELLEEALCNLEIETQNDYEFVKEKAVNIIADMMNGLRPKDPDLNLPDITFEEYATSEKYDQDYDTVRYIVEQNIENY